MYCYSNEGHSMRRVDDDYVAQPGEAIFPQLPSDGQLAAAFPKHESHKTNLEIHAEILALEKQANEPRLMQEALIDDSATWKNGPYKGKTSLETLILIRSKIEELRKQLPEGWKNV